MPEDDVVLPVPGLVVEVEQRLVASHAHDVDHAVDTAQGGLGVGRENWGLTPETVELLARVDRPIDLKTFVTPTCIYCPKAAVMAHRMALASPGIRSTCIESEEMSHLASGYQIMMVPKMVVNEVYDFVGALPEVQFVTQVLQGSLAT